MEPCVTLYFEHFWSWYDQVILISACIVSFLYQTSEKQTIQIKAELNKSTKTTFEASFGIGAKALLPLVSAILIKHNYAMVYTAQIYQW